MYGSDGANASLAASNIPLAESIICSVGRPRREKSPGRRAYPESSFSEAFFDPSGTLPRAGEAALTRALPNDCAGVPRDCRTAALRGPPRHRTLNPWRKTGDAYSWERPALRAGLGTTVLRASLHRKVGRRRQWQLRECNVPISRRLPPLLRARRSLSSTGRSAGACPPVSMPRMWPFSTGLPPRAAAPAAALSGCSRPRSISRGRRYFTR